MSKRPIYYDLETTGVKPDQDRIIEIAAYDPVRDQSFCEFVHPGIAIPELITNITGINDEMVKDAPGFDVISKAFVNFCEGDVVLIAHNNDGFDKHFLKHEFARANVPLPDFAYIDTLKWARKYRADLPKHTLQYLREIYGIAANNAHRALDDVVVMYQLFSMMIGDLTMEQVIDLLKTQPQMVRQMPFGKHRGVALEKLPKSYLKWLEGSGALEKPENEVLKKSMETLMLIGN
ncbi:MAG: 3'-5' exonuclease DinG [Chlamydiia bacterium]|nr:3'-5' exonuclease DinG [Chlamydiia bacterium]